VPIRALAPTATCFLSRTYEACDKNEGGNEEEGGREAWVKTNAYVHLLSYLSYALLKSEAEDNLRQPTQIGGRSRSKPRRRAGRE
jgi:hypothetical protein